MVPARSGPVLESEGADLRASRDGRSRAGVRTREGGVSQDRGGVRWSGPLIGSVRLGPRDGNPVFLLSGQGGGRLGSPADLADSPVAVLGSGWGPLWKSRTGAS